MAKRDLKKLRRDLYGPPKEPVLVQVPPLDYLMIDGEGDPNTSEWFQMATEALYAVGYSIKFMVKAQDAALDFVVPPLEGLWWAEDMSAFDLRLPGKRHDKSDWLWTLMIMMPEPVDEAIYRAGHEAACARKCLVAADEMRFEGLEEGSSAQVMHIGPYDAEGPTVARLHKFIAEQGHAPRGKHHEIYLSDPRRAAPEKLRTVIQQPVA